MAISETKHKPDMHNQLICLFVSTLL